MFDVKVLGTGCPNCKLTEKLVRKVAEDNSIEIKLEKVEDIEKIMSYEIMATPGVVINNKIVHSGGVPSKKAILKWFQPMLAVNI